MVLSLSEPVPETLVQARGRPQHITRDGRFVILAPFAVSGDPTTRQIRVIDTVERRVSVVAESKDQLLHSGFLSADEQWLAFHAANSPVTRQLFVIPFRGTALVPSAEWIAVSNGEQLDREPRWSADGGLIYFLSERDGSRCIWAQKLDKRTKKPAGEPFAVFHAHSARLNLNTGSDTGVHGLSIVHGQILVTMVERTGDLWLARWD
jgi:hypothetical protein